MSVWTVLSDWWIPFSIMHANEFDYFIPFDWPKCKEAAVNPEIISMRAAYEKISYFRDNGLADKQRWRHERRHSFVLIYVPSNLNKFRFSLSLSPSSLVRIIPKWIQIFCGCWCKWIICVHFECVGTYGRASLFTRFSVMSFHRSSQPHQLDRLSQSFRSFNRI